MIKSGLTDRLCGCILFLESFEKTVFIAGTEAVVRRRQNENDKRRRKRDRKS